MKAKKVEMTTMSLAEMCLGYRKAGVEEERKKWIKEAIKAGILISKPEELVEIIEALDDARWAGYYSGINEAVEYLNVASPFAPAPSPKEQKERADKWQAKLKEWGIE